jgi:hypothetical protein
MVMSEEACWRPILHGDQACLALRIAEEVADQLVPTPPNAFWILLDAYLARELNTRRHAERALNRLQALLADERVFGSQALYYGVAGLGFVLEHVSVLLRDWVETDGDPCAEFDSALLRAERRCVPQASYDLISGSAGVATYAVERLSRAGSKPTLAADLLRLIVERLDAHAERTPSGVRWLSHPKLIPAHQREYAPSGYYNLGLAHGVPALAVVLAHAIVQGIHVDRAWQLLDGAVAWIGIQQGQAAEGAGFPAWIAVGQAVRPGSSREAWCYGGLGVAVALLNAAELVSNHAWSEMACAFAGLEATRRDAASGVVDACLCHGAAGNAHLYNRLYQATGETVFIDAARRWFDRVFAEYRATEVYGGFRFWGGEGGEPGWRTDHGFLSGCAGVALALLAAAGTVAPEWDRLLLANLPVRIGRRCSDRDSSG